jgi:hypothetical protein
MLRGDEKKIGAPMLPDRLPRFAAHAAIVLVLCACAGHHHPGDLEEETATPPVSGPIVLDVENHNWADIVLYIVHDGRQTRFAEVGAAHDLSIEIPPQLQGSTGIIRLAVRRIGGRDAYLSESVSLRGGSSVRLTVESTLARSSVAVW